MKKTLVLALLMGLSVSFAYADAVKSSEPVKAEECGAECSKKYSEAAKGCTGSSDSNCFQGAQQAFSSCSSNCSK